MMKLIGLYIMIVACAFMPMVICSVVNSLIPFALYIVTIPILFNLADKYFEQFNTIGG